MKTTVNFNDVLCTCFIATIDGTVSEISNSFTMTTGYTSEDIMSKNISQVFKLLKMVPEFDMDGTEQNKQYFLFTRSFDVKAVSVQIITMDESEKVYIFTEEPDLNIEGKFSIIEQLCRDNAVGIALYSVPEFVLLKANEKYLDNFDEPWNKKEYSLGKKVCELMPGLSGKRVEDIFKTAVKTGRTYCVDEYRVDTLKKGIAYWDASLIPISVEGKVKFLISSVKDVTDRVEKKSMLKSQRDFMYRIIDILELPIIRFSFPDMNIIEINQKACEYLEGSSLCSGMDPISTKCRTIYDLYPFFNSVRIRKLLHQMAETKNTVYLKGAVLNIKDKNIYGKYILQPLINSKGEIIEVLSIFIDLTKEIEKSKALSKLIRTQEEFFSFISHEFKTPITVTSTAIQAMKFICGKELSDTAKGFIEQIDRSSLQQLRLVNNLLDISRSDAGYLKINKRNLDIVSITKSLIDSVVLYAKAKGVDIVYSSSMDKKILAIDDEKYERIILNLLSNAIKFTPEGKKIYVNLSTKKKMISIEVKDEGIGIPEDKHEIIFQRFKQSENGYMRNSQGTGIGLFLVKKFIKAMGGSITLDSKEGQGSTFTVLLPGKLTDNKDRFLQTAFEDRIAQAVKIEFSNVNAK